LNQSLKHIAFIMDGNGRWATARKHARGFGHRKGVDALIDVLDTCYDQGVDIVTVYAFSTENWSRPQLEIKKIFDILNDYLIENEPKLLARDARLVVLGDEAPLPKKLQKTINRVRESTAHCAKRAFCLALNYGGRAEILRAVNTLLASGATSVTEQEFAQSLYTAGLPDPELIVRTGGKQRLSNFLLFQGAYSEIYFTDTLWPDFNGAALEEAIAWYRGVTRNFGGISDTEASQ